MVAQGTPVRYSKAIQLVHEFSGALVCIDVQERAASEGFAMKVVLKTVEPSSGESLTKSEFNRRITGAPKILTATYRVIR